jgi:hypothetical protein
VDKENIFRLTIGNESFQEITKDNGIPSFLPLGITAQGEFWPPE